MRYSAQVQANAVEKTDTSRNPKWRSFTNQSLANVAQVLLLPNTKNSWETAMRLGSFVAAFTFLVCSLSANAGVIYEWKPVKKQLPSQFSMSLEFDRATVESGSFSLHVRGDDTHILPGSGLIRFCVPYNCYSPRNEPFNHDYGFGFFDIDVTFIQGGFLSGSLRLYDFQMELEMASGFGGTPDHLFTIYKADADYGMGDCGGATGIVCSGGTGHIRQVSEPASLALLGVGVVSAFVNRRRKVKI